MYIYIYIHIYIYIYIYLCIYIYIYTYIQERVDRVNAGVQKIKLEVSTQVALCVLQCVVFVLQCAAICHDVSVQVALRVLQCVSKLAPRWLCMFCTACCIVLPLCCSVLPCVTTLASRWFCVCCSLLQCVAFVLQCVAMCCSVSQR